MEERDIDFVELIEKESFSKPWSRDSLFREIKNENSLFLVFEEKGIIKGYVGMYLVIDEADITNVAVGSQYRRNGIGYELMKTAIDETEKMGYQNMTLEVRKSNEAAIELYKKLGFEEEGIRKKFYEAPIEDAVIMWKR